MARLPLGGDAVTVRAKDGQVLFFPPRAPVCLNISKKEQILTRPTLETLDFPMLVFEIGAGLFSRLFRLLHSPHLTLHLIYHLRADLIRLARLFREHFVLFVLPSVF